MLKNIINNEKFVVIHSSLKKFNDTKLFINEFIDEIKIYPHITFLFPCFNYDFLKTQKYNFETSKSQVGQFCDIIKNNFDYVKSNSPVFSFIIIGPNKNIFLNCNDSNSFGSNSLFDLLVQKKEQVVYVHLNCLSFTQIHYWEQLYKVPYRYQKKFTGKYIKNNCITDYTLDYYVRDINLDPESIGENPNEILFNMTNYKTFDYMGGKIYFNNLGEINKNIINALNNDIYSLVFNKNEIITKINSEGYLIYKNIEKLYPMCRSITGNDINDTLKFIQKNIPINIHKVKSGTNVFDWTVPQEWNIKEAYIKNSKGEIIIDIKNHFLHLMSYSRPVNDFFTLDKLKEHIYTLPEQPDLIPYLTTYYKEHWGFCMTHNDFLNLKEDIYQVVINTTLEDGYLTYGDLIIKGKTDKEILISSYCCHPQQCNDSLSGTVLSMHLAMELLKKENYYTYRFVFIPETIGAITYLHYNLEILKKNVIGGYTITCVGDEGDFTYLQTRKTNQLVDKITKFVLESSNINYKLRDFITCGSDERQYNYPGIDLNIGSLMKTKYGEFKEYHTSGDNLFFITAKSLDNCFDMYLKCIYTFENNKIYKNKFLCEPKLGKYGLYNLIGGVKMSNNLIDKIRIIGYYLDGNNDIIDICNICQISFNDCVFLIGLLLQNNLIYSIE